MLKSKQREGDNKKKINDYIVLLKCAHNVYDIKEDDKIKRQVRTIAEHIRSCYNAAKLRQKTLETILLYIQNLTTEDETIILPEGKVLLEILK